MQPRLCEIRERLEDAQDIMVSQANLLRREHQYMTGNKVFLEAHKLPIGDINVSSASRKLQHRFAGPFTLGKQYSANAFELKDVSAHWCLHKIFNVDHFKPYTADHSQQ
jgi:hypothetical protein